MMLEESATSLRRITVSQRKLDTQPLNNTSLVVNVQVRRFPCRGKGHTGKTNLNTWIGSSFRALK